MADSLSEAREQSLEHLGRIKCKEVLKNTMRTFQKDIGGSHRLQVGNFSIKIIIVMDYDSLSKIRESTRNYTFGGEHIYKYQSTMLYT